LAKDVLLHGRKVVRKEGDKFHHKICCVPKGCTVEGFVDEVSSNALMFLGNFHMNCPHDLAFGLDRRGGIVGESSGKRGNSLGCFRTIPNVLELEAKSNRGAIWVKPAQNTFQELSEAAKVNVLMQVEQPAYLGDKEGLD